MFSKFVKKDEVDEEQLVVIKEMWEQSFGHGEDVGPMGLLDETIIGILVEDSRECEEIIAISFLLNPTNELLDSDNIYYTNVKLQGVTENDFYLYNFCVAEKKKKKGYGTFLLEECEKYVKSLNKNKIILFVKNKNIPAISLYNKFHFKVQRATPDGFIMEKNLS